MSEVLGSPFIVPVSAFALALGIVAIVTLNRYHIRKLQSDERMAAIARGLPVPSEPAPLYEESSSDPRRNAANSRKAGIILVGVGLGIIAGLGMICWIVQVREVMAGTIGGIIPLFIGVGMLIDYRLQVRDMEREESNPKQPSQV